MSLGAKVALSIIAVELFLALLAGFIAPHPYDKIDLGKRLEPPSPSHILGTDPLGRDVFSRLVYALRTTITISAVSLGAALIVGTLLGIISAILGGLVDTTLLGVFSVMYAIPGLFIAVAVLLIMGSGAVGTATAITITLAPMFFRLSRAGAREVLAKQYVEAAKALGASTLRIALNYVGRELVAVVIPTAIYMLSDAIALEATFSVIGLGIPPPTPSLGNMVAEYKDYILAAPWLAAIPVVVVALTIASLNTLAKELAREFSIVTEVA